MARKHVYWLVAAVGIVVASSAAWWVQNRASLTGQPAVVHQGQAPGKPGAAPGGRPGGLPNVEVAQVKAVRLVDDAQAIGTLYARQSVVLRPEVSGRVVQVAFSDGAHVRKGQLLVRLDDALPKAELSQAQAQMAIARANLKRNEELVAQNFVAQRVLDESRANLQVAEAQVQLAEARLARTRILAPFDGVLGMRNIHLGAYVKDGAELVNLEDVSSLYVDFRLPERYQSRVASKQPVQVELDALPGRRFAASVQAVDPVVDANGRALLVRAVLAEAGGEGLRPGMFARVSVVFGVNEAALMVPEEAIVPQGGRQLVFKLEQEGEGDGLKSVSHRTEIKIGLRRGGQVQVLEGLVAGDTVVTAGQQRLQRDGTPVRVIDMSRTGPVAPPAGKAPAAG